MDTENTRAIGQLAENSARHFLESHGLTFIANNVRAEKGQEEIDLIMQDGDCMVFIEVRSRANSDFGHALDSITPQKQSRIVKAATLYLIKRQMYDKVACRFDVVTQIGSCQPTWIKDAFRAPF